jgi:RND family efflux transporter MFP subunit
VRTKLGLLLVLLAAVAGLLWSLGLGFPRQPEGVDAIRVRRGDLEVTLAVTGVVEARTVDLAFEVPGRLGWVVAEGQRVEAGQVLAALDVAELVQDAEQARHAERAAEEEARRLWLQVRAAQEEARRAEAAVEAARAQVRQAEAGLGAARARLRELLAAPREEDVRQAEAAVRAAQAAWEQARETLAAQERLYREGAVSRAQLDAARAQHEAAWAQLQQAQAQLDRVRAGPSQDAVAAAREQVAQAEAARQLAAAQLQQARAGLAAARSAVQQAERLAAAAEDRAAQAAAARRAAEARRGRGTLRAPFSGQVTRVYLRGGAFASPGVPVLTLADSARWVTAEVEEADVGKVRVGQRARVTADAYPGLVVPARVARVADQVEVKLGTRVVRVRLELDSPVTLRVGTGVDVDIVLHTVPGALLVPLEAVVSVADGGAQVYVVQGGVVRAQPVRTGDRNEDHVAVLEGLREGDLVALAEPGKLRHGQRVWVRSVR